MPEIVVIGGPNGAGKSTFAYNLLLSEFGITEFVNADTIALGLSANNYNSVALEAGRIMLKRIKELYSEKKNFAFETTLASKTFIPFLRNAKEVGYKIAIAYFWLESSELAINRIKERVLDGGHDIEEYIVKRRYKRSVHNFRNIYIKLAYEWMIFDNSNDYPVLIAERFNNEETVYINNIFKKVMTSQIKEPKQSYRSKKICEAVERVWTKEMDRRRKLGLPIYVSINGKIIDLNPQPENKNRIVSR